MPVTLMRSKLFVPGSRPKLFSKAFASEADGISIDLEDAVEESHKAAARNAVGAFLRDGPTALGKIIIVRVNGLATPHFGPDLEAAVWPAVDLVNLPGVEGAEQIRSTAQALARLEAERGLERPIGILANIESPRGLRCAAEIAAADPRVEGLQLGFGDLFEPLGIDRTDAAAVRSVQLAVRLAAGEAGIWAYDSAFAAVNDAGGFRTEAEVARRLGSLGKTCIHPSQVALANAVFQPSEAEIAWSLRVVEATERATREGIGAFLVDGRMIDAPFSRRAEAIVALAQRLGLLEKAVAGSKP
jgi:citrate lyase subunit beta / citryl-CoA lyase